MGDAPAPRDYFETRLTRHIDAQHAVSDGDGHRRERPRHGQKPVFVRPLNEEEEQLGRPTLLTPGHIEFLLAKFPRGEMPDLHDKLRGLLDP